MTRSPGWALLALVACGGGSKTRSVPPDGDVASASDVRLAVDGAMDAAAADRATVGDRTATLDMEVADRVVDRVVIEGKTPVFVVVGYAGRRLRSVDLGRTWIDDQRLEAGNGADNQFLLRTVAFHNGVFVAAGWQIHTSPDGTVWTQRTNPVRQWVGDLGVGNNVVAGVGGVGDTWYSADGITWMTGTKLVGAGRSVAFGNGMFMGRTDVGSWWRSTDGRSWTLDSGGHGQAIAFCDGAFKDVTACSGPAGKSVVRGAGVWVRIRGTRLERSDDGVTWTGRDVGPPSMQAIAYGLAP